MLQKKKVIIFFFIIIINNLIFSHPHLFIKPSIKILGNKKSIEKIKVYWIWDEWWSNDVISGCDKDRDGNLNSKETELVYKDFFINIKDFGFFTILVFDGKKINIKNIDDFKAAINNKIVTYEFLIPVNIPIKNNKTSVKIIFNDDTIYTAFDEIINIDDNKSNYRNFKSENYSYYGKQITFDYVIE